MVVTFFEKSIYLSLIEIYTVCELREWPEAKQDNIMNTMFTKGQKVTLSVNPAKNTFVSVTFVRFVTVGWARIIWPDGTKTTTSVERLHA